MIIHRSQRAELLLGALADLVRTPAHADPVRAEIIVVQSLGMERWLAQQLSLRLGIWANPAFPFPRNVVLRALKAVLGPSAHRDVLAFDDRQLVWPVAAELDAHLAAPPFAPLARYVADDPRGVKRMQLAQRVARAFDDYVVYRPDLVRAWDAGEDAGVGPDDAWQPALWRAVTRRLTGGVARQDDGLPAPGATHMAACVDAFAARVDRAALERADFPARVSLFGITTLPRLSRDGSAARGGLVDDHLSAPPPAPAAAPAVADGGAAVRAAADDGAGPDALDAILDPAAQHPLVASCGRVAREFDALLLATGDARVVNLDAASTASSAPGPRPPRTLLASVQADIAANRARPGDPSDAATDTSSDDPADIPVATVTVTPDPAGSSVAPTDLAIAPAAVDPADRSITVHACHGPMREVEVLRDQLLDIFERHPDIQPHDVAVMAPDIDAYAPYVEAVFGVAPHDRGYIPYRIADRAPGQAFEVVGAMSAAVATVQGRLTATAMLDLLAVDLVRQRFGIAADQLDDVRRWVDGAGIRWAVDAEDRAAAGQPALAENTWRFGLDRLFLGYAMPGADRTLYRGVLPFDDIEGGGADLLGRLADACAAVFDLRALAGRPRTLGDWRAVVGDGLARMVHRGPRNAWQHQLVRDALDRLATQAEASGFTGQVDLSVAWDLVLANLGADAPPHGFLGGGVTFCALLPMRSIPFRVVALLGMNDGAFPRLTRRPGFDLLTAQPRIGDRSTRDDDRHMFLEAILAARDGLVITCTAQDLRDGRRRAPSVAVTELLEVIETAAAGARDHYVVWHPSQPFSTAYFTADPAGRLFSYSERFAAGARALASPRHAPPPFVPGPLPPADDDTAAVNLDALARFARNPAATLVRRRLGVWRARDDDLLSDREPLAVDDAWRRAVAERWLPWVLAGTAPADVADAVRAAGLLMPGTPGDCAFADFSATLAAMARAAAAWQADAARAPVHVDLAAGPAGRVVGTLRDVWPRGLVWVRFAKVGRGIEMDLWVRHLALCALAQSMAATRPHAASGAPGPGSWSGPLADTPEPPLPATSVLVGRAARGGGVSVVRFTPVPDAARHLAGLVDLYRLGQRVPVPLFEQASRAFAGALAAGKADAEAHAAARKAFRAATGWGWRRGYGDLDDREVALVYGDADLGEVDRRAAGVGDGTVPTFETLAREVYGPLLRHRDVVAGAGDDEDAA